MSGWLKTRSNLYVEHSFQAQSGLMEKNAAIHSSDLFFDDTIVTSNDNQALVQQIIELRCALDDESQNYKRKLQHYEESQERQAQVVLKLQQKVLQYKAKCSELEFNLESKNTELERYKAIKVVCCCGFWLFLDFHLFSFDLELWKQEPAKWRWPQAIFVGHWRLASENRTGRTQVKLAIDLKTQRKRFFRDLFFRTLSLSHINTGLREQLDQATNANHKLSHELKTMNHDWILLRGQMEMREREWRDEEKVTWSFFFYSIRLVWFIWWFICPFASHSMNSSLKNTGNCWGFGARLSQWSAISPNWSQQPNATCTKSKWTWYNRPGICKAHVSVFLPITR